MNKKRMSEIIILIEKLDGIKNDFENIQEEEENYYQNIPENLLESEKAERSSLILDENRIYYITALSLSIVAKCVVRYFLKEIDKILNAGDALMNSSVTKVVIN